MPVYVFIFLVARRSTSSMQGVMFLMDKCLQIDSRHVLVAKGLPALFAKTLRH